MSTEGKRPASGDQEEEERWRQEKGSAVGVKDLAKELFFALDSNICSSLFPFWASSFTRENHRSATLSSFYKSSSRITDKNWPLPKAILDILLGGCKTSVFFYGLRNIMVYWFIKVLQAVHFCHTIYNRVANQQWEVKFSWMLPMILFLVISPF